jgi:hypothetical protein|tara:strand:+ start:306 stop:578 length:273 start_codon:yes stop_codon:yes gene_type:complete
MKTVSILEVFNAKTTDKEVIMLRKLITPKDVREYIQCMSQQTPSLHSQVIFNNLAQRMLKIEKIIKCYVNMEELVPNAKENTINTLFTNQ